MEQNELGQKITPSEPIKNCIPHETIIRDVRLAMAYVPYQKFCSIFSPIEGLTRGTVFPELYSPYPWRWIADPWPWENDANFRLEKEDK